MNILEPAPLQSSPQPYKTYFSNTTRQMVSLPVTASSSLFTPSSSKSITVSLKPSNSEYSVLIDTDYSINTTDNTETIILESEPKIIDYIPQIYVGSLTIFGLFLFYRILVKR
jgi:hypothetical protein